MKNARVVIGANFGDEGKGLVTDYLSQNWAGMVVRFNGGAQAAHTVRRPDGKHHVFGHFGSGSLTGVPTYLGSRFVVHPRLFRKEYNELQDKGIDPIVYINEDCMVSTFLDAAINVALERHRGSRKNGSCGIGFNETITRHLENEFTIDMEDIHWMRASVIQTLEDIYNCYFPYRMAALGIPTDIIDKIKHEIDIETFVDSSMEDIEFLREHSYIVDDSTLETCDNVVFEGAQGLELDEYNVNNFPHVTRSRTGMKNAMRILREFPELKDIEVFYVTRAYATRHGAGPFPLEYAGTPYKTIVDTTNIENANQGALRFGMLNIDRLSNNIFTDSLYGVLKHKINIVVTCLDQMPEVFLVNKEFPIEVSPERLAEELNKEFACDILFNYSAITPTKMKLAHKHIDSITSV